MKRNSRRLIYSLVVIIWLIFMGFPFFAFLLATRGEIQLGRDAPNHLRLFLVQEVEAGGIGVEWTRPRRDQPACSQSTVRYFLWEGDGENVSYCACYDPVTGDFLSAESLACPAP